MKADGWYDDDTTGGYVYWSKNKKTLFTAPGAGDKAVVMAVSMTAVKVFFYSVLVLWGLLQAAAYASFDAFGSTSSSLAAPLALVLGVAFMYIVLFLMDRAFRSLFLKNLEKVLGFIEDSPPNKPPLLVLMLQK